jgi:hypothetical protein
MIRACNGSDPNLKTVDGAVGACGATFDDVTHWTICPHRPIAVHLSEKQLLRLFREVFPVTDFPDLYAPGMIADLGRGTSRDVG